MKITVLGACGAWPAAGQACSGYLVEHDGFRMLLDLGYAALPACSSMCRPNGWTRYGSAMDTPTTART
nr:hypothetical protein GCM10020093_072620 [Planobispora longispora]